MSKFVLHSIRIIGLLEHVSREDPDYLSYNNIYTDRMGGPLKYKHLFKLNLFQFYLKIFSIFLLNSFFYAQLSLSL